jgi:hypothetical protein
MLTQGVRYDLADENLREVSETYPDLLLLKTDVGSIPSILPCNEATMQAILMFRNEIDPEFRGKPNRAVQISENLYQMSFLYTREGTDGIETISQHRFKDGLLESSIYLEPNGDPANPDPIKYAYGMPPIEEQQRFENLLTHRKSLFDY